MAFAKKEKRIVIVGGGFGGVWTALRLAKYKLPDVKITLISDRSHFEYTAGLHRVIIGGCPLGVCIPLQDIFKNKEVEVIKDRVHDVDLKERTLKGESADYSFDFLVMALGSQIAYFNIPGIEDLSYSFKNTQSALRLKHHLHELFTQYKSKKSEDQLCAARIMVVGGGATGVEAAGDLAQYARALAKKHGLDPSLVSIELIEAGRQLLGALPEDFSRRVEERLRSQGVNIFFNRAVLQEEIENVHLKDMQMCTKTLVWAAGMKPNALCCQVKGFKFDAKGRVQVDPYLQAQDWENIFVIGDGAAMVYGGMAQTAIDNGKYVAGVIAQKVKHLPLLPYIHKRPAYAIPVGKGWAAALAGPFKFYGWFGWFIRKAADFRVFLSLLSFNKAVQILLEDLEYTEECPICEEK